MPNFDEWTVIGCFGRPHGVKGYITVHSFTQQRDDILSYDDWHIQKDNQLQIIKPLDSIARDKYIITTVDKYDTREEVAALTNQNIMVKSSQLPILPDGEYYWHQLLNLKVRMMC